MTWGSRRYNKDFVRTQLARRSAAKATPAPEPQDPPAPMTRRSAKVIGRNEGPPPTVDIEQAGGQIPGVRVIGPLPKIGAIVTVFWAGNEPQVITGATGGGGGGLSHQAKATMGASFVPTYLSNASNFAELRWTAEQWDVSSAFSPAPADPFGTPDPGSTSRYIVPEDGYYEMVATVMMERPERPPGDYFPSGANYHVLVTAIGEGGVGGGGVDFNRALYSNTVFARSDNYNSWPQALIIAGYQFWSAGESLATILVGDNDVTVQTRARGSALQIALAWT